MSKEYAVFYAIKEIRTLYDVNNNWRSYEEVYWYCFSAKDFVTTPQWKYILNPGKAIKVLRKAYEETHSSFSLVEKRVELQD